VANPLTMLKLKATGVQMVHEMPVGAAPARVWESLLDVGAWFVNGKAVKQSLELRAGGKWVSERADGTCVQMAVVTYYEPGKLLRLCGQMGMTHVPVTTVVIFEMQPEGGGKRMLWRLGTRMHGLLTAGVKQMYREGWGHYLPQLVRRAEG